MVLEVGRRLINGVWKTGILEEPENGGGGSLPAGQVAVQILGPYTIDYNDDAAINDHAFQIAGADLIPDGLFIFDSLVEFTVPWAEDLGDQATWGGDCQLSVTRVENVGGFTEWINRMPSVNIGVNIMDDIDTGFPYSTHKKRAFRLDKAAWAAESGTPITDVVLAFEIYSINGNPFVGGQARIHLLAVQT